MPLKGYKQTEEHKQNRKGKGIGKRNYFYGKHLIPWNKGKFCSNELKEKISQLLKGRIPWNKGRKNPEQSKRQRGKNNPMFGKFSGKNNPNWKGGVTTENEKIRKSFELQNWRMKIFERDKFLCQMPDCDKTERYLHAHHIKTFSKNPDWRTEIFNGLTLCKKCHNKTKWKEEKFENMFLEIIKARYYINE